MIRPLYYFEDVEFLAFCEYHGFDSDDEDSWIEYDIALEDMYANPHA